MEQKRLEAYVDAAAAALDLTLDPAHRPGVLRYFELAAEMAARVAVVPLDPAATDPAPVFTPIAPDELPARGAAPAR